MTVETHILIENITDLSDNSTIYTFSDKKRGAGFSKKSENLHTATFDLEDFIGKVKLQATLELYPGDEDWTDIRFDDQSSITSDSSTVFDGSVARNFYGNWVWIRAAYVLDQGKILRIRHSF